MLEKRKMTLLLGGLAIFFVGLWAYYAYDVLVVSRRTAPTTSVQGNNGSDSIDPSNLNEDLAIEKPVNDNDALSPPNLTSVVSVPEPEDRIPGTKLSDQAKADLGITEPIPEEQVFYFQLTPDDTLYPQWYTNIIEAPLAWNISTGSPDTLVAVVDSGYALDHEDLNAAWFINNGEQGVTSAGDICWTGAPVDKQTNGCDDDQNGFADDWRGWDFANNDNNTQAGENSDVGANHGTKSAGLIGARGNNGTGVASINWQTRLLPLQGLADEGFGYSSDIASAIYYAVEMGADVVNLSLGGPAPDSYTRAAVRYAQQNNVIVVASSGNCGVNQTDPLCVGYPSPGGMAFPARYPEVIAVGATTSSDARASFSSYGNDLDLVAPGSGAIQTPSWSIDNQTSLYADSSFGTSFSAPIVSGAIAILRGEYPELTADEFLALAFHASDKPSAMAGAEWTPEYGYGRLNVNNLLAELEKLRLQLRKGDGQLAERSAQTKPLISTMRGHTTGTKITTAPTRTYCVTTPQTLCRLTLDKRNSTELLVFDSLRTNNQGVAIFEWSAQDASSGTWDATVRANAITSDAEKLFIE